MASLLGHPAAPHSGNLEISALADIWAAFAVREVLEPDADDILKTNLRSLVRKIPPINSN
jgi:hypothetical protein